LATTKTKLNRANLITRNAKVMAGIQMHLATMNVIQLANVSYTPASLTAVFQNDSNAIAAATTAHTQWQQTVATQKSTNKSTQVVLSALRSFLLAYFGKTAVAVLGDFGMTAPKAPGVKTAAAKAASVAKAKATRAARGTKGSVQKQSITGNLDTTALEAAINDPLTSPVDKPAAAPAAAAAAPTATPTVPAPAAPVVVAPVTTAAATAPAAPAAGAPAQGSNGSTATKSNS
jgi:hypothetical protein